MGYFRQLLLSIILPLLPAAASLHAKKETTKLQKLYRVSLPILLIVGLSACLGFVILIPSFIRFWLGAGYEPVILACQIICWAVFFNLLTGPGVYILQAMNRQKPVLIMSTAALILFCTFTYIAARINGFNSIFIANVAAEAIVTFSFLIWIKKKKAI